MDTRRKRLSAGLSLLVAAAIILALALLLRGCSDAAKPDPVVSIWHSLDEGTPEREYLEGLAAQPPDLGVAYSLDIRYYAPGELQDQLAAAKQSDSLPTVVFTGHEDLPELATPGILADLSARDGYAEVSGSLLKTAVGLGKIDDIQYALPFSLRPQILLYNPNLFVKSSQVTPSGLDIFGCICMRIGSLGEDIHGLGVAEHGTVHLAPFFWSGGGDITDAEGTTASGYLDSDGNAAIVNMFAELYASDSLYHERLEDGDLVRQFGTGKLGMVMADAAFVLALEETYPDFVFEPLSFDAEEGILPTVLGGVMMSVTESQNADLGWAFIAALAQNEVQGGLVEKGIFPSGNVALESAGDTYGHIGLFMDSLASAKPLPNVAGWEEMDADFIAMMDRIAAGESDAATELAVLAKLWDAMMV